MVYLNKNKVDLWNYVVDTAVEGLVAVDGKGVICHINLSAQRELQLKTNAVGRHFQQVFCPSLPLDKCWVNEAISKRENLRNHRFFIQKFRSITKRQITDISDKAYDLLMAYDYPGNIRELENIIEHAFTRTKSHIINENKLPLYLRNGHPENGNGTEQSATNETNLCSQVREALVQTCWNRGKAAQKLGMSRTTLWRRMKECELVKE